MAAEDRSSPDWLKKKGENARKLFTEGKYTEAAREFTALIELRPWNALYYNNRGSCLVKMRQFHLALQDYRRAIAHGIEGSLTYEKIAGIHATMGDTINQAAALGMAACACTDAQKAADLMAQCAAVPRGIPARRGKRILCLDGGGIRGLVLLETLKHVERACGRPLYEAFDYICGTSTGAILAIGVGKCRLSLDACERLYWTLAQEIFGQPNSIPLPSKYSADALERALKQNLGEDPLMPVDGVPGPKVAAVTALSTHIPPKLYVCRNYELPAGVPQKYAGTSTFQSWQAARASSAAPSFFPPYSPNPREIFIDGGMLANNPTAVALEEAQVVFGDSPIDLVVSVGTGLVTEQGSVANSLTALLPKANWLDMALSIGQYVELFSSLVEIATSSKGTDAQLLDLCATLGVRYIRYNAPIDRVPLDEKEEAPLRKMVAQVADYMRKQDLSGLTPQ